MFAAVILLGATLSLPGAAALARTHAVTDIRLDGRPVASAAGVIVTPRGAKAEATIKLREVIADGTRIDVPAHVTVTIVSSGAKSTITLEPGSSVTFLSTGSGELVSSNGGKATFDIVPGALDFFRVQSGQALTAAVHGTVFSIDAAANNVTFTCTRGDSLGIPAGGCRGGGCKHHQSLAATGGR